MPSPVVDLRDDVLRSVLLMTAGVAHGFNLRTGGVSEGSYSSFNLGRSVGDEPEHVEENHRLFAAEIGYAPGSLFETSQVHGAGVHVVASDADPGAVRTLEADALVAPAGGIAVGVRVADCVPILLCDTGSGAVAAVHAGWRGTLRGVIEAGVEALLRVGGGEPRALRAAILPHIGCCCFEVGTDVAAELAAACPELEVVDHGRKKPHVDLAAIVGGKLRSLGLGAGQIERVPGCTRCSPERFFSFRRDGQRSGRHLAAIVSR